MARTELKPESRGEEVRVLQSALGALGHPVAAAEIDGGFYGKSTEATVRAFQILSRLEPNGIVDEATIRHILDALTVSINKVKEDPNETERFVDGKVTYADGRDAVWVRVAAFNQGMRSEELLAETVTDNLGRYHIRYGRDQVPGSVEREVSLSVKVFGSNGEPAYAPSLDDVAFDAQLQETLDIALPSDADLEGAKVSEYELIEAGLRPLLRSVPVVDLQDSSVHPDLTYLNKETGLDATLLTYYVVAHRLSALLPAVNPDVFYAVMREGAVLQADSTSALTVRITIGLNTDTQSLLYDIVLLGDTTITGAVSDAVTQKLVPTTATESLSKDLAALAKLTTAANNYVQNTQPGQTLAVAQSYLTPDTINAATTLLSTDALGNLSGLVTSLAEIAAPPANITPVDAATANQITTLLGLSNTVVQSAATARNLTAPADQSKLALLSSEDWVKHLADPKTGFGGQKLDAANLKNHADSLVRTMEATHPTQAFSAQLRRDPNATIGAALGGDNSDAGKKAAAINQKQIADFLDSNPKFDLKKTVVKTYARQNPNAFSGADGDTLKANLSSVRRVFRIAPTHSQTSALMAAGIKSAGHVKAMGKSRFVAMATAGGAFSDAEAEEAFNNAANLHVAAGVTGGNLVSLARGSLPAISKGVSMDLLKLVDTDFPNLQTLFNLGDQCECDECNSVWGPAAYLVELLQFLEARQVLDSSGNPGDAKTVVMGRRPDIYDLDLNCNNAMTEMSFIDYICELLEDAVSAPPSFSYTGALTEGQAPPALVAALQGQSLLQGAPLPFTVDALVFGPDSNGSFIVRDASVVCKLTETTSGTPGIYTVTQLRQTYLSADQLLAAPEYMNLGAYNTLLTADYAFGLPFDLYLEECQSYFAQQNVQRSTLMSALQVDANPTFPNIAADSLGIPLAIHKLIVTSDPAGQAGYWNNTLANIAIVENFLNVTGLQYSDLQTLLTLPFIQGLPPLATADLYIQALDSTCDLTQKKIDNLDNDVLDRMHRFIRLLNATGWDMTSMDWAIRAPGLGNGVLDDNCLTRLAGLSQLINNLDISLDQGDSFYGPIPDTDSSSLYYSTFLNQATVINVDTAFNPANVAANELAEKTTPGSGAKMSNCDSYVALALGAATSDIDLLIAILPGNQILSMANLALLYSSVTLAQSLQLSITDFLSLNNLITGDATLDTLFGSPAQTMQFISQVGDVTSSGVAPADLGYLLTHTASDLSTRELSSDAITAILVGLQTTIQAAFTANMSPFLASASVAQNSSALRKQVQSVPGIATADLATLANVISGLLSNSVVATFLDSRFGSFVSDIATIVTLAQAIPAAGASPALAQQAFLQEMCSQVGAYLYQSAKTALVASAIANGLSVDPLSAAAIRDFAQLRQGATSGAPVVGALLGDDSLIDTSGQATANPPLISETNFPDQYRAIRLVQTIATLLSDMPVPASELAWMLGFAGIFQNAASNAGNGTSGPISVTAGAIPGPYQFSCTQVGSNSTFSATDPHGNALANLSVGSQFDAGGISFLVAPGAAPFALGDSFTIVTTPSFSADSSNTGSGACGAITDSPGVVGGVYSFACIIPGPTATFSATDPNGNSLPILTVGSVYSGGGLSFLITAGGTDYATGDSFTITTAGFESSAGNKGDGSAGMIGLSASAITGSYTFKCVAVGTNANFSATDPTGKQIASLTVGSPYAAASLNFTVTSGAISYAKGDSFAITISPQIGFAAFANASGSTGNGVCSPIAVLPTALGGVYRFTCTAGGATATFTVADPTGAALSDLTVGTQYGDGGLILTVSSGSTKYKIGDAFTITAAIRSPFATFGNAPISTGNGDCGPISLAATATLGSYVFECVAGGATATFSVVDPLGDNLPSLTVGAAYSAGGIGLTVSSGSAAYKAGDVFVVDAMVGWMQIDNLPCMTGDQPTPFTLWDQFYNILTLGSNYPAVQPPGNPTGATSFFDMVGSLLQPSVTTASVLTQFSALTGYDSAMLSELDATLQFSIPDLVAYTQSSTYLRLISAANLLRTLNLDEPSAVQLCAAQLTQSEVNLLTTALQGKYSASAWLTTLQSVQDRLREQKRDALVDYLLITNPTFTSTDDLYDYFLIDVETESCQVTSRIVQAHQTVQLFVQRCLSGLEPNSSADLVDDGAGWQEWNWMSAYRVWQVQMEIFLYPAGYLDPTLLTNASDLYTDALNNLTQNAPTDTTASDTIESYLESLDGLSFLDVLAVHYQSSAFTTHVFARTKGGNPPTYYYRQFVEEQSWTPWSQINLDVTGDDLLCFDVDGRLFLAWPILTTQPYPAQTQNIPNPMSMPSGGQNVPPTQSCYCVQMAISQQSGDTWLPKKTSTSSLQTPYGYPVGSDVQPSIPDPSSFRFFFVDAGAAGSNIVFTLTNPTIMVTEIEYITFDFAGITFTFPIPVAIPIELVNQQMVIGTFALYGCKGYPEAVPNSSTPMEPLTFVPNFKNTTLDYMRFQENSPSSEDDLSITKLFQPNGWTQILKTTPGVFDVTYPNDSTILDLLLFLFYLLERRSAYGDRFSQQGIIVPSGTMMPFFYEDNIRGYCIVPGLYPPAGSNLTPATISTIIQFVDELIAFLLKYLALIAEGQPVIKVLEEMVKDPEYLGLIKEFREFLKLRYGMRIYNFYHPVICLIREAFYEGGLAQLMTQQEELVTTTPTFKDMYTPQPIVVQPYPEEDLEFGLTDAYSVYNWELFYHLPFLLGNTYSANQSFQDADACFKYIFNPNGVSNAAPPARYWVTKPFFQMTTGPTGDYTTESLQYILDGISSDPFASDPTGLGLTGNLMYAIQQWRENPFEPYTVAANRPLEYMKGIVIAYCQMLLNWGDSLFSTDQREQITQATQYYILVDKLLGPEPRVVPPTVPTPDYTYNQLWAKWDQLGNAMLDLEDLVPDVSLLPQKGAELPPSPLTSLYFCVPEDQNIVNLRTTVQDRLTKIRNCKDINGNDLVLALFSPPLNPMELIRAAAAGISISSLIQGMNAPLPFYRFNTMSQKATELAQRLSTMLSSILQAQEKEDAETLTLLRSTQEIQLNQNILLVKQGQLSDATQQIVILNDQMAVTQAKIQYYSSRPFMNTGETTGVVMTSAGMVVQAVAAVLDATAGGTGLIPQVEIGGAGVGGTPYAIVSFGGQNLGPSASSFSQALHGAAGIIQSGAGLASTLGGYQRRQDDWTFQLNLANLESAQITDQIKGATIRQTIAQQEVSNQQETIANLQALDTFYHTKFTNQQLYTWMVGQLSGLCYKAYQLAFTTAMKAQRCFQYELASNNSYIQFQYWDSTKMGLLSAEALLNDIKTMELAYLDLNQVQKEMTKHISIGLLDPLALRMLKETGSCIVTIPEALFDMDAPGQYMRRIKTIALTIPCVAGPYTSVNCKLTLISSKYRNSPTVSGKYAEVPPSDPNFIYNPTAVQSITTSNGQNDSARFDLNLKDERYLDFEGAGAISQWMLELPTPLMQFDYTTITDAIIHMRYTALDAGSSLELPAVKELVAELNSAAHAKPGQMELWQGISIRDYWPNAWQQLKSTGTTTLTVNPQDLPFFAQGNNPSATSNQWLVKMTTPSASFNLSMGATAATVSEVPLSPLPAPAQSYSGSLPTATWALKLGTQFTVTIPNATDLANLCDLAVIVGYQLKVKTPTQVTG